MTHISYIKGEKKKIKLLKWVFFLPMLHMDDPSTYFCLFFPKGTATKHMSEWSDGF